MSFLTEMRQRIRDVRQGPDGFLYVLTEEDQGALLRMSPRNRPWSNGPSAARRPGPALAQAECGQSLVSTRRRSSSNRRVVAVAA